MSKANICNLVIQGLENISISFDITNIIVIIDTIIVSVPPLIVTPNIFNLILDYLLEVSSQIRSQHVIMIIVEFVMRNILKTNCVVRHLHRLSVKKINICLLSALQYVSENYNDEYGNDVKAHNDHAEVLLAVFVTCEWVLNLD